MKIQFSIVRIEFLFFFNQLLAASLFSLVALNGKGKRIYTRAAKQHFPPNIQTTSRISLPRIFPPVSFGTRSDRRQERGGYASPSIIAAGEGRGEGCRRPPGKAAGAPGEGGYFHPGSTPKRPLGKGAALDNGARGFLPLLSVASLPRFASPSSFTAASSSSRLRRPCFPRSSIDVA